MENFIGRIVWKIECCRGISDEMTKPSKCCIGFVDLAVVSFHVQCWEEPLRLKYIHLKTGFIAFIAKYFNASKQVVVIAF